MIVSQIVQRMVVALILIATPLACVQTSREPPRTGGLLLAWSAAECANYSIDGDRDGLDDRCELALAQAFAPELIVDSGDCLWTADSSLPRLGGGYFFAAQRTPAGVRIAFLPAYYRDCGWSGAVCVLVGGNCGAHAGDSELIVVDVVPDSAPRRWRTDGVFLSAHCFGRSDGRCRWYRSDGLRAFAWADSVRGGAPRAWVARGKHAHYPSRRACDRGHWFYDSCDENRVVMRFPVLSGLQNAGSRDHPLLGEDGCLASGSLPLGSAGASAGARECLWDPARPFWGWQADRKGTAPTAYARYLELIAGF